jgi:hypothetical protein
MSASERSRKRMGRTMPERVPRFCKGTRDASQKSQRREAVSRSKAASASAESSGNRLPITHPVGFEPGKSFHQIKGRVIDLDGVDCRTTTKPLAPTRGMVLTTDDVGTL